MTKQTNVVLESEEQQPFEPSVKVLKKVLDFSQQHQIYVSNQLHKRLPESWTEKKPSENGFYQLLFQHFRSLDLYMMLNISLSEIANKKPSWADILYFQRRLSKNAMLKLREVDFEGGWELIKTALPEDSYTENFLEDVLTRLSTYGEPEYQNLHNWMEEISKNILSKAQELEGNTHMDLPSKQDSSEEKTSGAQSTMSTLRFLQNQLSESTLQATLTEHSKRYSDTPTDQIWQQCLDALRQLTSKPATAPDEALAQQILLESATALWAASEYRNSLDVRLTKELEALLQLVEDQVGKQQNLMDLIHQLRQLLTSQTLKLDQQTLDALSETIKQTETAHGKLEEADRQVEEAFPDRKRDPERFDHLYQLSKKQEQQYQDHLQSLHTRLQELIPTDASQVQSDEALLPPEPAIVEETVQELPQAVTESEVQEGEDQADPGELDTEADRADTTAAEPIQNPQLSELEPETAPEEEHHPVSAPDTKPQPVLPEKKPQPETAADSRQPDPILHSPATDSQMGTPISDDFSWATLNRLIWFMIGSNRMGLAYHLALTVCDDGEAAPDVHPDLLQALALAPLVRSSIGEVVNHLQQLFQDLLLTYDFQSKDFRQQDSLVLLAFAATLRPALLAPQTSGAFTVLETLPLNDSFSSLYQIKQSVVEYVHLGLELTPALLRGTSERGEWEQGLKSLQAECRDWWQRHGFKKLKYHPTTQVWRQWLEPGGFLGRLLTIVLEDRRQQTQEVRDALEQYSRKDQVESLLDRTDRTIRKGAAAKKPIEGPPRQEIFNHTQDALQFCKRWLEQIDSEPRGDDGNRQTDHSRQQLIINLQKAREDLESRHDKGNPARQAAFTAARRAIDDLNQLLAPRTNRETQPPIWEVLHGELLKLPQLSLDRDWQVRGLYTDPGRRARLLVDLIQNDPNWEDLFTKHCDIGNLAAAQRVAELLERVSGNHEHLKAELEQNRNSHRRKLEASRDTTLLNLEKATADDLLNETERLKHLETIEDILVEEVEDFRLPRERLQAINEEIDRRRQQRAEDISQRLKKTGISEDDPATFQRIAGLLNKGDLLTANEYISLLEAGKSIPESTPIRQPLEEYFPDFVRQINDHLGDRRNSAQLAQDMENHRQIGPLDMQRVPGAQARSAAEMFRHWQKAKKSQPSSVDVPALRGVLEGLGFRVEQLTSTDGTPASQIAWLKLRTQPLADQNTCPIPRYGSMAQGSYRILGMWGRPSEEEILTEASQYGLDMPTLVLYFGRLTEQRRRSLAWMCRERRQKLLVLDETLLLFLCQERGLRLSVMFQCAFPFTVENPYITTSSDVPVEMFFGRKRARDDIFDRSGTNLVYGGRQLGKTALLRDVTRQHHQFEKGIIVRWIDLKAKEIGLNLPPGEIWSVIAESLREFEIIRSRVRNRESIVEDIRNWLVADQQRRILLLLDEADAFLYKDSKEDPSHPYGVVNSLKNLMEQTHRRFKVVFAGLHNVQRFSRDINTPIAHLGTPICIGPLLQNGEINDALQLIKRPLETLGYQVPDEVAHRILSHTNYYPSLIQLFCRHLLEHLNETPFDPHSSPPYLVTSQHVEDAFQQRELRRAIADRFKLTLDLDTRYRLIALLIALASLHSRDEQEPLEGVDVAWVKEQALSWWRAGFEDSSYDAFNTILDEMVGLGILRYSGANNRLYTLRSPNIINLLGSKDEIEQTLLDVSDKEPPLIYDAETFRRQINNDAWIRSPLTGQQESELYRAQHGVAVMLGMPIAGIHEVVLALRPLTSQGLLMERQPNNRAAFERDLERILKERLEGATLLVVLPATIPWQKEWVDIGQEMLERKRAHSTTKYRLLFIGDPASAWHWLEASDDNKSQAARQRRYGLEMLTLKPWHDNAFRQWLSDVNFGQFDDSSKRDEFMAITGGWNMVLAELGQRIRQERSSLPWESKLAELEQELQNSPRWFEQLGLVSQAMPTLRVMATLNEPVQEDLLADLVADLVEKESPARMRQVLRWADLLGIVRQTGRQEWQLNEFVARQIQIHGG